MNRDQERDFSLYIAESDLLSPLLIEEDNEGMIEIQMLLHDQEPRDAALLMMERLAHQMVGENDLYLLPKIAQGLEQMEQYDLLLAYTQVWLAAFPYVASALAWQARACQKLNHLSAATIANDQALLLDAQLPLAWINRSGLQLLQGKFVDALRTTYHAITIAPLDVRALTNKSIALLNLQRLGEALEAINHALIQDPKNAFALQIKGEVLLRQGRYAEALVVSSNAVNAFPHKIPLFYQALHASRALEDFPALVRFSEALVHLRPDDLYAWEQYVCGLRGMGEHEKACDAIDQILNSEAQNARFWFLKGDSLHRLGWYRDAIDALDRALNIDPDYYPAARLRERSLRHFYQEKKRARFSASSNLRG